MSSPSSFSSLSVGLEEKNRFKEFCTKAGLTYSMGLKFLLDAIEPVMMEKTE
jgi:hypothetical protein|tara:strand:- start:394 stop:549 length:156 start_codon:yes stop_codon:yes gene_type:complete